MATYIKPDAIKDASIEGIKIKDGTISSSKIDETVASKSYADAQVKTVDDKLTELESKVDELENGEKQVLTFLRGSTTIPCDFKQGHIYKCTFARYIPYASESPRPMKVTLSGDGVTNSYMKYICFFFHCQ